ncbi:MAG: AsnC family transcriptional regulator [Candidatus Woesearchaeota archaeon]
MMEYLFKNSVLDKIDIKILDVLRSDARMPLKDIAVKCRISKQTALYRINKLLKDNVIKGFHAKIDYTKLGYSMYYLFIQTRYIEDEIAFIKDLSQIKGCVVIMKSLAQYSYNVKIITKDLYLTFKELENFFNDKKIVTSHFILRRLEKAKENLIVDDVDKKIIKELSLNCRLNSLELSRKLNLSYDIVHSRLKTLISKKILDKFMTVINFDREDFLYYSILLKFSDDQLDKLPLFESTLGMDSLVVEKFNCIGEYGYIFEVVDNNFLAINNKINKIRSQFYSMIRYSQIVPIQKHYFYESVLE